MVYDLILRILLAEKTPQSLKVRDQKYGMNLLASNLKSVIGGAGSKESEDSYGRMSDEGFRKFYRQLPHNLCTWKDLCECG